MKTAQEIKDQVAALKAVRPKVVPRSMFGTDNLAQLDAQVYVLENLSSNTDIYDEYDHGGIGEEVLSAALEARQWLDGDSELDDLASDWPLA